MASLLAIFAGLLLAVTGISELYRVLRERMDRRMPRVHSKTRECLSDYAVHGNAGQEGSAIALMADRNRGEMQIQMRFKPPLFPGADDA